MVAILDGSNAGGRYVIMSESHSRGTAVWLQAWIGLVVGVCLAVPVLLRLEEEGWTGGNLFFIVAGTALSIFWTARLVFLGWTRGGKSQRRQHFDGSSSE